MKGFNFFCFLRKYLIIWSNYCNNSALALMGWLTATTNIVKYQEGSIPCRLIIPALIPWSAFSGFDPVLLSIDSIVKWSTIKVPSISRCQSNISVFATSFHKLLALSEYWQRGKESVGGRVIRGFSNIVESSWTDILKNWDLVYREMVVVAERLDSPLMPKYGWSKLVETKLGRLKSRQNCKVRNPRQVSHVLSQLLKTHGFHKYYFFQSTTERVKLSPWVMGGWEMLVYSLSIVEWNQWHFSVFAHQCQKSRYNERCID